MAETSACVVIEKVSDEQKFRKNIEESLKLTRRAYGEKRVSVKTITSLGKLKGDGVIIFVARNDGDDAKEEEILFLVDDEPREWMISAGCSSGSQGVWRAYKQILESLSLCRAVRR